MSKNTRHTIAWRYTSDLISAPPLASTSLLIFIVSSPGPDFLPWRPLQASFSSKDISTRHHPPRPSSCTLVFYFILASSALCALSYTPLIFMHRAWPERQKQAIVCSDPAIHPFFGLVSPCPAVKQYYIYFGQTSLGHKTWSSRTNLFQLSVRCYLILCPFSTYSTAS